MRKLTRAGAALALFVLALAAHAKPGFVNRFRQPLGKERFAGQDSDAIWLFEFAPEAGTGLPVASTLCESMTAADKSGAWWCFNGDGTMLSGSAFTLSGFNSPTTQSRNVCPNGPSCTSVTEQLFNGTGTTNYFQNASATALPGGDVSGCVLARSDAYVGTLKRLMDQYSNIAGQGGWFITGGGVGTHPEVRVRTSASTETALSATATSTTTVGAYDVICFSYDYITDGTSVLKIYVNGVLSNTSSTAVGPMNTGSTRKTTVASSTFDPATDGFKGAVRGAFMTEAVLDATRMAAIARAVLADTPTGSKSEPVTFARTGSATCSHSASMMTLEPKNRPCVRAGGLQMARAVQNLLLRSEELTNGSWANVGTPSPATADSWVTPMGGMNGETIGDDTGAAFEGKSQTPATTTAGKYIASCYAQQGTLGKMRLTLTGTGNGAGDTTCDFTTLGATTARFQCTSGAYTSAITALKVEVLVGTAAGDTGTILVWGCQLEVAGNNVSENASYYIPTAGSSVTSTADSAYATLTGAPALSSEAGNFNGFGLWSPFQSRVPGGSWKDGSNTSNHYILPTSATNSAYQCSWIVGGALKDGSSPTANNVAGTDIRGFCSYDGTNIRACINQSCANTAKSFTNYTASTRFYIGMYSGGAGYEAMGVVSKVCAASTPTGCAP